MDKLMETIFLLGGNLVALIGLPAALLSVGFLPVYIYGYTVFRKEISYKKSKPTIIFFMLSTLCSLVISAVLIICAIAMGAWG